ncbi:PREDICTED: cytoplasmic dynein 2 heavy chain 1-like, partial [Papilio polytes]|uniref:cytoplasmic dynein 2 heavy chain 1-like n=1 Tax=Papilio polytes TaxID=76194 RepID=UPI0006760897
MEPADIIAELRRSNVVRCGGGGGGGGGGARGRFTLLVRGLHRARRDAWGSCALHDFLLQLVQQGGFWCAEEGGAQWSRTAQPQLVATADASAAAAAAAAALAPRLAALLQTIVFTEPDDEELAELSRKTIMENISKTISEKEVSQLIDNMLAMYKEVVETFTARPHYKWNASHLKKWCEGVRWYAASTLTELHVAIKAEADLIFKNRLVSDEEKAEYNVIFKRYLKHGDNDRLFFKPRVRSDGVYLEAVEYDVWYQDTQKLINQCLTESDDNVFTESGIEACIELATLGPVIARASSGGVCVCVGGAGCGRGAAAALLAAALPAALYTVQHKQFATTFKNALSSAGECTRTIVLVEECAAREALACAEALRRAASLHALLAHVAPAPSPAPHHALQLHNIKQHLAIVILLNKDQENLPDLFEKYPFLYNDSNIVWLERWSEDTLRQMPVLIIQRLLKENVSEVTKEDIDSVPIDGFVSIYNSIEAEWLRAPLRYVNFVKSYYFILSKKKTELIQRKTILSSGVEALRRARGEVSALQQQAGQQEAELSEKQAAANHALDQIGATVRANTHKKEEMHALKKNIEIENEKLQIRKKEIEAELASVEPVIKAAQAAVGDIRPEALSEVRSLRAPPDVVRDVLEGVLRLMGIADTSWHSMKTFLSKRGVKEDIRCLDARQVSAASVQAVRQLVQRRGASFEPAAARRASAACAPLAAWVRANLDYAAALARVTPLQLQQAQLHRNLQEAEAEMSALSSGLSTVEERVAALQAQLGQHSRDAAALEHKLHEAKKTLSTAHHLLDQLADEYDAWELDLQNISKELVDVSVRSLLAAAYVVYLPDLTEPQAREYIKKWSALLGFDDESFSVINFLASAEKQLRWEALGLPVDQTALKNAVLIDQALEGNKCGLTPLVLDPEGEMEAWLRRALADTPCDFVPHHSDKLPTAMQYATRLNRILVITEVEAQRAPRVPARRRWLLLSRAPRPPHAAHAPHALSPLLCAATLHALTDQLVHYALQQQNPEVNEKSKEIKTKKAALQKQQYELQENLLKELSKNGDILHDANVLSSLEQTRATAATIQSALAAARALEAECAAARHAHRPAAARAARLALALARLAARRPLLALPPHTAQRAFVHALHHTAAANNVNNVKTDEIIKYMTRRIVERVLLSLHKNDKYIVVLYILKEVYEDLMPDSLWNVLIGNFNILEDQNTVNEIKNKYPWVPEESVKKLAQLKVNNEDLFRKMCLDNEAVWAEWCGGGE